MGAVPLVEFDSTPYFAKGPVLQLIQGADFGALHLKTEKLAPKYWGVDRGPSVAELPPNIHGRLMQLQHIMRAAPSKTFDGDTGDWIYERRAHQIESTGNDNLNRTFTIKPEVKKAKNRHPMPKKTVHYFEAYREPENKIRIIKNLVEVDEPVVEIMIGLEDWRMNHEGEIDRQYVQLGHTAYELFMFSARAQRIMPIVKEIATINYLEEKA